MNLSEFRAAVRARLGANAADSFHTDANLNQAVNAAVETFSSEHRWPWLLASTTVSVVSQSVSVPADWSSTHTLVLDGDPSPLVPGSLVDIDVWGATTGRPVVYADSGSGLLVAPTPDGSYTATLRYFRTEPALSADSDVPLAPARFHSAIVAYAAYLRLAAANMPAEAQVAVGEYQGRVARYAREADRTGRPKTPRVRPGHGWG